MAYVLNGTTIKSPTKLQQSNSIQMAQLKTLDGSVHRDYFGSNKRIWELEYENLLDTNYDTIKTIYDSYVDNASPVSFQVTDANYTISQTNVHVDFETREFNTHGANMLSDCKLTLTEA